jgi:hypothetical protein
MNCIIQKLKDFPVTIGTVTLHLSGCQISGSSTLKESGTADGDFILSGYWKQGSRLKLKGRLSPADSPEQILIQLVTNLLQKRTLILGNLSFTNAMLCGYTLSEQQDIPEVSLLFYCPDTPTLIEVHAP